MGVPYIEATVRGAGKYEQTLQFLVDSGAQYTLLPEHTWKKLKLKPNRRQYFGWQMGRRLSVTFLSAIFHCRKVRGTHQSSLGNRGMSRCWVW